jgi:hypothetical protein
MLWRNKLFLFCLTMGILVILLFSASILYNNYYGHMRNDEALNTFQILWPIMPKGTIPVNGGIEILRKSDPKQGINPWPLTPAVVEQGRKSYGYYCVQCHGPRFDGRATVGQSFYPLPTDLLSPGVQSLKDGELFYGISLGQKRQPPLYATVSEEDRWAIIHYLRFLAKNKMARKASE